MNYYQHHIGDYRRDTTHLSLLEHGVYRQLLDMYYISETAIPEETESVMRRLCARTDEERNAVITVLNEFFSLANGYSHARCEREISSYKAKADRARNNGKLGGRPLITEEVISGLPETTQTKANHKPLTINHKPLNKQDAPKRVQFVKPTFAEVAAYCRERGNAVHPDAWLNHYDSNGWRVGKNPMKDWKAAIRTWETNGSNGNAKTQHDNRSRAQRHSDKLDEIARASIERAAGSLDGCDIQTHAGPLYAQVD